jgi:4-amino-4-deoxy-L-arabinose transferase-like glycosyltransferase
VVLFVAYGALLLLDLEQFPVINPDEPGYAEPAWTLITRGEFGAPMYAGMFGMEHRIYTNWPGRGVTTVLPYLLLGPTLVAARLASAVMALLLALFTVVALRRALGRALG